MSTSSTINSTASVVVCTGTNVNLTLPASPATGRSIQIVNHGVGDVLLSSSIRVSANNSFDAIPASANEYRPYISTNSITILWDGIIWRLVGY